MVVQPDALICVENGCTRDEVATVSAAAPPSTRIIETADNIGFAAAVNLGMAVALEGGADWVLLLNNDAVVAPQCLRRCVDEALKYPRVAAVGPAISFADNPEKLWFGGGEVSHWFAFTRHRGLLRPATTPPPSGETAFVTGCCMVISTAAWKSEGAFRSDFFAYYEDAEWCQRVRERGWSCRYVGEVLCSHAVSASFSKRGSLRLTEDMAYYLARNPVRFAIESQRWDRRLTRLIGLMVVWNAYNAWRLLQAGRLRVAQAYIAGIFDGLRGHMGARANPWPRD